MSHIAGPEAYPLVWFTYTYSEMPVKKNIFPFQADISWGYFLTSDGNIYPLSPLSSGTLSALNLYRPCDRTYTYMCVYLQSLLGQYDTFILGIRMTVIE